MKPDWLKKLFKRIVEKFQKKPVQEEKPVVSFEQKELFERIEVGDVVFCKMPVSEKHLKEIKEGHKERPYVIVNKTESTLVGYPCTSQPQNIQKYPEICLLYNRKWDRKEKCYKPSYVTLRHAYSIPIENIRFKCYTLEKFEKEQISRRIFCFNKKNPIFCDMDKESLPIKAGDMIQYYGQKYFMISQEEGYPMYKEPISNGMELMYRNTKYYVDASRKDRLSDIHINGLKYIYSNKIIEEVKKASQKKCEKKKIKEEYRCFTCPVGTIFKDFHTGEERVYLYDTKKHSHCLYLEESDYYEIHRINWQVVYRSDQLSTEDTLLLLMDLLEDHPEQALLINELRQQVLRQSSKNEYHSPFSSSLTIEF